MIEEVSVESGSAVVVQVVETEQLDVAQGDEGVETMPVPEGVAEEEGDRPVALEGVVPQELQRLWHRNKDRTGHSV